MSTLALAAPRWEEIIQALDEPVERAGIVAARAVAGPDGTTLLVRNVCWAPKDAHVERTGTSLVLRSSGWVPSARAAIADGGVVVFIHTHPGGTAAFSEKDDRVDAALLGSLPRLGATGPYASMVVGGTKDRPTVGARIYINGVASSMTKIRIVSDRLQIFTMREADGTGDAVFDRQIRMLGDAGQRVLSALHVAVVGAGGTGSATAEQLTRLGIGTITIIDDDIVSDPTPSRGYGTTLGDLGRPKAEVVAQHLRAIGLPTRVHDVVAPLQHQEARMALASADVVFSCVDGHGARLVLNRWAYAHLAPVIDTAVLVSGDAGAVAGIDGRVTWLAPTTACLLCRGRLDAGAAYAEMLAPEERRRLAGEGYAREAETQQPAVVTLTSLVASLATSELLFRLFAIADSEATEILARLQHRELRRNRAPQRDGCFCSDETFLARGGQHPHLDLTWPA